MNLFERNWDSIRRALRWQGFWWVTAMAGVLIVGGILSWLFWGDLKGKDESLSTAIRNVGLVIGGIEAMLLAAWRSTVAERQADTGHQSLLGERYERSVALLGHENLAMRLGGIAALRRLAAEYPDHYHVQVNRLLCEFVPKATDPKDDTDSMHERELRAIIQAIGARKSTHIHIERNEDYHPDLRRANFNSVRVSGANLSNANLTLANLSGCRLFNTDLRGVPLMSANLNNTRLINVCLVRARLNGADLSGAFLQNCDMNRALLDGATLARARFSTVRGLTKLHQLRKADLESGSPRFRDVLDADTGEPIYRV